MTFSFRVSSFELAEVWTMFPSDVTAPVDTDVLSTFACWLKHPNLDAACGQTLELPATHYLLVLLSFRGFQRLDKNQA